MNMFDVHGLFVGNVNLNSTPKKIKLITTNTPTKLKSWHILIPRSMVIINNNIIVKQKKIGWGLMCEKNINGS